MAHPIEDFADRQVAMHGVHSFSIRSLPQRSHVICMNHDGNALSGSSRASAPVGSGALP
jgi:hypothetical protein